MLRLGLRLTPHGLLVIEAADDSPDLEEAVAARLAEAFGRGSGHGLMRLGAGEVGRALPPLFIWWRDFAARYIGALCLAAPGGSAEVPPRFRRRPRASLPPWC